MTTVAITSADPRNACRYIKIMESLGAEVRLLTPENGQPTVEADGRARPRHVGAPLLMDGVAGLLLSGGPDVDPDLYGTSPDPEAGLEVCRSLDELELWALGYALDRDMPVLAICRGMQLLNVAFGGKLIQDLPGHRGELPIVPSCEGGTQRSHGRWVSKNHLIYLSPGAKAAAVIGMAGFFRVNSYHHQGLREPQKSPRLMATAYSVEDGLIEGLESPEHSWVIGLQCHPELQDEVPRLFANLFAAFHDRAAMYLAARV